MTKLKNTNVETRNPIYVILDNIRSALNVGSIFRTCDAVNIEKLLLCGITAYPPHNKIPKTALGATKSVPWEHYKSTKKAISTIRQPVLRSFSEEGYSNIQPHAKSSPSFGGKADPPMAETIVSVELTTSAINHWDYKFEQPTAVVFGNEVSGISKEVLKMSDAVIKIPMFGKKKSLNVATSCGVVLYEMVRQLKHIKKIYQK